MIIVVALAIVMTGLTAALVTVPRWFLRSLHRYRLWRVRDCLVDDVREGNPPADHPAVIELLSDIHFSIETIDRLSMWDMLIFGSRISKLSPAARRRRDRETDLCSLEGLSKNERALLLAHRGSMSIAVASTLLLGSWLGAALVLWQLPKVLWARRRQGLDVDPAQARTTHDVAQQLSLLDHELTVEDVRPEPYRGGTPLSQAADDATIGTWLGRRTIESVDQALAPRPRSDLMPA